MTDLHAPGGAIEVEATGLDLLRDPLLDKGTAFDERERDEFGLHGLLPPHVGTLDEQVDRRLAHLRSLEKPLEKYVFLRELQDLSETLFYALVARDLRETLPLVYTPTVGEGCQKFSHVYRRSRGLFLGYPQKEKIREILAHPRYDKIECIVVSDGERILGLGDQGAGGMGIPIGKLALYVTCAGLHPATTLPILLDVGTDNAERLADPLYVGWKHERVRGAEYDAFIASFIAAVKERWPNALLQFEDFARGNAGRLLETYRDELCCFNDDIQGTAAVAAGALLAGFNVAGTKLADQRIAIFGAGSAGCGIAAQLLKMMVDSGLPEAEARTRFYAVDVGGLLVEGQSGLQDFQLPFAQHPDVVRDWKLNVPERIDLYDVVVNAKPTVLIGVSGQPGTFTEEIVRAMASTNARPVIFPLSNPTSRAEAVPQDVLDWTDGRAVIGTGSPFAPFQRAGVTYTIDQTNNAYVFPGVGLGVLAVGARRISEEMFIAAAETLAAISPTTRDREARNLLPPVHELRNVARTIARAVAFKAREQGHCDAFADDELDALIAAKRWEPVYVPYRRARAAAV